MSSQGGSRRRAGELAQPSCSLVGIGSLLLETQGSFAVVIHGDVDCINPFLKVFPHRLAPDVARMRLASDRFYTTGLLENEVIAGGGRQRLVSCIRTAVEEQSPRVVFVLGTCLSEMIGEDLEGGCAEAQAACGVPVMALRAGGLRLKTQAELLDRFGTLLASLDRVSFGGHLEARTGDVGNVQTGLAAGALGEALPPRQPGGEVQPSAGAGGIVLLGYPGLRPRERTEVDNLLAAAGGRLLAELPARSSLDAWSDLASADLVAVADPALWPELLALLTVRKVSWDDLPPPMGLLATRRFYGKLLERCPHGEAAMASLDAAELAARAELAVLSASPVTWPEGAAAGVQGDVSRRVGGLRVAYCIGSIKNYVAGQLAQEGLADLPVFAELGCDVEILIQERDDQAAHDRVCRNLAALGIELPYRNFNDPGVLSRALSSGGYDLAYCQDHLAGQVRQAGIAHVRSGALRPGFVGMVHNARTLEAALSSGFQGRYGRYLRR